MPTLKTEDEGWVETWSGRKLHFLQPPKFIAEELSLEDIVWPLSRICRYGGHCRRWLVVAEHSVHLCRCAKRKGLSREDQASLLFHDATEAFLSDLMTPIKRRLPGGGYEYFERNFERAMAIRFGVSLPLRPELHDLDSRIVRDERSQIMRKTTNEWGTDQLEPLGIRCRGWSPFWARQHFRWECRRLGIS